MTDAYLREDAMLRVTCRQFGRLLAVWVLVLLATGGALAAGSTVAADEPGVARAAWLLQRGSLETLVLTGLPAQPDEFGGGGVIEPAAAHVDKGRGGTALRMLASAVLPGAGEAMLGIKRGNRFLVAEGGAMIALDIFSWTQVAKNSREGDDLSAEYYRFADLHYSDERLVAAYDPQTLDVERRGMGARYFESFGNVADIDELNNLDLYVTKEEDRREYYENLGKWDQFVFGWDDFVNPANYPGYEPTDIANIDLEQPWISENRNAYRLMRNAANDAYRSRDHWLTLNLGLRVFSVLQTAWLDGLFGGGGSDGDGENRLSVAGHDVRLIAQPTGLRRATVAAAITF